MNGHFETWFPPVKWTDEESFIEREGPLHLIADWMQPVFIHHRIDPAALQPHVPYELDLCEGFAWVSLVAFTMRDMRPSLGGEWARRVFWPFREQRFLNVRTYVKHGEERGIHFIAEWISDWISSKLGPGLYGLPYRHGRLDYDRHGGAVNGVVRGGDDALIFRGFAEGSPVRCENADEEFLLERYAAFNAGGGKKRFFRVWHRPWSRQKAVVEVIDDSLLRKTFDWWPETELQSAHVSAGATNVRMGRPRKVEPTSRDRRLVSSDP